jgi:formamidopyrimidine-DNA glycosylase
MPEYPDITVYIEHLETLLVGQVLKNIRIKSPFLLRTAQPPITALQQQVVQGFERIGKRIVFVFPGDLFLVLHLMVGGRLHWADKGAKLPGKIGLAVLDFANGGLILTEAGTQKRASLHVIKGRENLANLNPGGLEIFGADFQEFRQSLLNENHTLKRALTDPHLFSGIGNTYSDEILHRARLSPVQLTRSMNDEQIETLFRAAKQTLKVWTDKLRNENKDHFPKKVTAFREDMAVHGKFGRPCPDCGSTIQRIRYANNETNYCPNCQTGGRLLADRSLSRLLKRDWPKTLEELEEKSNPNKT